MSPPEERAELSGVEENVQARGIAPDVKKNSPVEAAVRQPIARPFKAVPDKAGKAKARHADEDRRRKIADGKSRPHNEPGASRRSHAVDKGGSRTGGKQVKEEITKRPAFTQPTSEWLKARPELSASPRSMDAWGHRMDEAAPPDQQANSAHRNVASIRATPNIPGPTREIKSKKSSSRGGRTNVHSHHSPSSRPTHPSKLQLPAVPLESSRSPEDIPKLSPESTTHGIAGERAPQLEGDQENLLSPTPSPSRSVTAVILARKRYRQCDAIVSEAPLGSSTEKFLPWHGSIMNVIRRNSSAPAATDKTGRVPPPSPAKSRYSGTADYQMTLRRLRMNLHYPGGMASTDKGCSGRSLWCVLPIILLIAILAGVLFYRRQRFSQESVSDYLQDERSVCTTKTCLRVVAFAAGNTDPDADPCVDFYRHSCGRWFSGNIGRRSYADENRRNFTARANWALQELLHSSSSSSQDRQDIQMARFYDSCRTHAKKRPGINASAVLDIMDINATVWTRFGNFQQLVSNLVAASLRTGIAGLVRVGRSASHHLVVDVGESLHAALGGSADSFLALTLKELGLSEARSLITAIKGVDLVVGEALRSVNSSSPFGTFSLKKDLDIWKDALVLASSVAEDPGHEPGTTVRIRGMDALNAAMAHLFTVDLEVAGLYSMLLLLAQVMKYLYPISGKATKAEAERFCLQATGEHMEVQFLSWLARSFEDDAAVAYLNAMVTALNQAMRKTTWIAEQFIPNASESSEIFRFQRASAVKRGCAANSSAPNQQPDMTYVGDFVSNIILARKAAVGRFCPEADRFPMLTVQQHLDGHITHVQDPDDGVLTLILPTVLLTPDLLHAEAATPSLDYSTLGVTLLVEWAGATFELAQRLGLHLQQFVRCAHQSPTAGDGALPSNASNVGDSRPDGVEFLPWALDTALDAARLRREITKGIHTNDSTTRAPTDRLAAQLFFRRFCQTKCGDKQTARSSCLYGVRHSHEFSKAFECRDRPPGYPC